MMYSRLTKFAKDPRIAFAEVVEDERGEAKVVAKSALPEV